MAKTQKQIEAIGLIKKAKKLLQKSNRLDLNTDISIAISRCDDRLNYNKRSKNVH